ncbi:UNVERIFIED_CONTAM: hypothetical protein GTU68_009582 [Idotea baltica]|nr:hypothetical protein [Idotea baltica]
MTSESDQTPDSGQKTRSDKTRDQAVVFAKALTGVLTGFAADTAACIRFFSRLPLPAVNASDDPAALPDFARIARAAPLAGTAIALPAAALGMLLGFSHLPELAVATITIGLLALTTGALHEDGLGDVADGFFGAASREKRLTIMKDSRIGVYGALALIVTTVLRVALLAALWQRLGPADAALILLGSEALSRAVLVWQWQVLPPARPDGLAARFGKPLPETARQAILVALILLLPAALLLPLPALSLGLLLAAGIAHMTGRLALTRVGGVTGDVLGAIQQLSGLGFLTGVLMLP